MSPVLFVLEVEMLTLKICQSQLRPGIELPSGQNAQISRHSFLMTHYKVFAMKILTYLLVIALITLCGDSGFTLKTRTVRKTFLSCSLSELVS